MKKRNLSPLSTFIPLFLVLVLLAGIVTPSAVFSAEGTSPRPEAAAEKPNFGMGKPSKNDPAPQSKAPFTATVQALTSQGKRFAALTLTFAEGHYTYAHSPDVDKPTELTLLVDGQPVAAEAFYPPSVLRPDFFEPQKQIPAYEGRVTLFMHLPESITDNKADLRLSMLVCSAKNCRPVEESFPLTGLTASSSAEPDAELLTGLSKAQPAAPLTAPKMPVASNSDDFPPDALSGLTPRYSDPGLEPGALFTALWLGLLAGLVLNVMPCVLPVLTIKITSLLSAAGGGDEASRFARFREHNLCFAAGILTWFILLALAVGLLGLAWGGLFQQVGVVYGLLILVFLLGLSLFDVFTLPVLDFKVSQGASPKVQAYLSGVVVTLLATPCSGPLLGGVLGWAASQPLISILLVFVSTGVGMASPYLLLAAWPGAAKRLPRPGAWTGVVERLAGFFLMGTALYLLSVLPESLRLPALGVLLISALAAWIWGQWGALQARGRQLAVGLVCLALVGGSVALSLRPAGQQAPWTPFSPAVFLSQRAEAPLLVEFTADWCPTCKVLERTVLTPANLRALSSASGIRLMKVDMTRPDPAAEALLRALGSVSIPVTAIFTPGAPNSPIVLRDLYTLDDLQKALKTATTTD